MEMCHSFHLMLLLPWSPSRRPTSTTPLVTIATAHNSKKWLPFQQCLLLKIPRSLLFLSAVVTSNSVREFSVVSAERGSEAYTFHLKQNITYRDCRHNIHAATPETLQITMERVYVMYVKEERILRYAITNKISPVGGRQKSGLIT